MTKIYDCEHIKVLKKLIKQMLKQTKDESYCTLYGEGYQAGYIEAIEDILKLLPK